MYQIFYKKKTILLTDKIEEETDFITLNLKSVTIDDIIKVLNKKKIKSIHLYHKNKDKLMKKFLKLIPNVVAAGGKIINSKNETLFIFRNNKWDLPKGKVEKNETVNQAAIREVIEETAISNVVITKPLKITYHIFKRNNQFKLKTTHWFEMFSDYSGKFIPQIDEGIYDVSWVGVNDLEKVKLNSFPNIKLLF